MPLTANAIYRVNPPHGWRCVAARVWLGLALLVGSAAAVPALQAPLTLVQAERIEPDGSAKIVKLPDEVAGKGIVERRYRLAFDAGPTGSDPMDLYLPGMLARGRITFNGHVVFNRLGEPLGPRPTSLHAMRMVDLPPAYWVAGVNHVEITLRAPSYISLSRVIVGPHAEVRALRDRKAIAIVFGPMLVATVIVCLGASVLLIYLRRRSEPMYAYFAVGAIAWGLHTAWSILPEAPLPGIHNGIWWTALYAFFVFMLLSFALRFAGYVLPRMEATLVYLSMATPLVLYGAHALGVVNEAALVWRLGLVFAAFATLAAVARSAWRQRSLDSALLVLASFAAASFGLRDWLVFQSDDDNFPIALAPYSALPLVLLVAWVLIDRFVRTAESLEGLNRELEHRVERKSAELVTALDHMRAARDRADSANRAKSSFLAAASHDLRQPIHALGLYLGALRQRPLDREANDIAQRMDASLGALDTMFNALLDISRMDAGVVQPLARAFDLEAMLRRLVEEFAAQAAQHGVRLSVRVASRQGPRNAFTDPVLLERVLRNLIGNAVKYTKIGGVLVSCRRRGERGWRVEVWDTGPGIADAERERVFDEFYQIGNPERDRRSGLGLGLSIVRRVSRLLQLPLTLHSRPGQGTRFVLDLPATDEAVTPQRHVTPSGSLHGLVVAIIEDDPEVRDSMRTLLESWGCRVVDGSDGSEVLAQWSAQGDSVQALIADLRLRGARDGIGEVKLLRACFGPALPALIVSGDSAPERVRLMQDSGLSWLSKPVPAASLRSWLLAVVPTASAATDLPTQPDQRETVR
ncbi:MAG: hybrid sensor histidine kinase/response regulator [Pseudomonadota bacterium]